MTSVKIRSKCNFSVGLVSHCWSDHIWIGSVHAKNQSPSFKNERIIPRAHLRSSHYLGYIVKVGFWPSASKRSKGRCLNSNEINPRHSQTPNGTIRDQLPFDQNHQGALQSRLKRPYQKSPHMSLAQCGGVSNGF